MSLRKHVKQTGFQKSLNFCPRSPFNDRNTNKQTLQQPSKVALAAAHGVGQDQMSDK